MSELHDEEFFQVCKNLKEALDKFERLHIERHGGTAPIKWCIYDDSLRYTYNVYIADDRLSEALKKSVEKIISERGHEDTLIRYEY